MTLEHLDTIIAFAAIMAGVSLFITTLTQMASALLGLRGRNLRGGLQTLLENLDPDLQAHAESLADEILRHPLISDSMFSRRWQWLCDMPMLGRLVSGWRYAAAIRVDEFVDIIKKLTAGLPTDGKGADALAKTAEVLKQLSGGAGDAAAFQAKAQEAIAALTAFSAVLPSGSPLAAPIAEIVTQLKSPPAVQAAALAKFAALSERFSGLVNKIPLARMLQAIETAAATTKDSELAKITDLVNQATSTEAKQELARILPKVAAKADAAATEIEKWFACTMDRVSQHFTVHMRFWTVLFSVIVAAALQLDALDLLKRLASDADLRARLVSSAEVLSQKADAMLVTSTNAPAASFVEAMKLLQAAHANDLGRLAAPSGFTNLAGGEMWFTNQLARVAPAASTNAPQVRAWLDEYAALVPQALLRAAANNLRSMAEDQLLLQLIPSPYPRTVCDFFGRLGEHLLGIIASAAFLSLGAPFWFNLLKSLSNLRPILAQKEAAEQQAAAKA
jgi:hypothetical protein